MVLFPELAITGYPPEDLVLKPAFVTDNIAAMHSLAGSSGDTVAVVGFVDRGAGQRDDAGHLRVHNAAALLAGGSLRGVYHKGLLPNYSVFDEDLSWEIELMWYDELYGSSDDYEEEEEDALEAAAVDDVFSLYDEE